VRQVLFFLVIIFYKFSDRPLTLVQLPMYQSISIGVGTIVYFFSAGSIYFSVLRASGGG